MRTVDEVGEHATSIRLTSRAEVDLAWSGSTGEPLWETVFPDGCAVTVERGKDGDHRFGYGRRAVFRLSADARVLLCAPVDASEPSWQRFLLDTVLFSTSVIRGFDALHASAVERPEGVVAFVTRTGGGKTSLAAELVRRGNPLFCDDVLALRRFAGEILAYPGSPLMNLPLAMLDRSGAPYIGSTLATIGDEAWVSVHNAARKPRTLAAICLVHRREGLHPRFSRIVVSSLDLLPHAVGKRILPGGVSRFQLLGDLALQVPTYRLESDLLTEPASLVDLVESSLAEMPASAVSVTL